MARDPQMRKALLTINNPAKLGLSLDDVDTLMQEINPQYYCRCQEIGKQGTEHYHIALYRPSPIRFSTLKRYFPTANIVRAYGSMAENREYVAKGGKWQCSDKKDTCVPGTFAEFGTMPTEQEEKTGKMALLIEDVHAGLSTADIVSKYPEYAFRATQIDTLRETFRRKESGYAFRQLTVHYLYGPSGSGKTSSIYKSHNPKDICRITSYSNGTALFDPYHGQKILVFEEFASQIPLSDMLNYLDIYPLELPARYSNRTACYEIVYITSNLPFEQQYDYERKAHPERFNAFLRRIGYIIEFRADGTTVEHKKEEYCFGELPFCS